MTEQDQQIADKIIAKLASTDGWIWVNTGWMRKDNLLIKAFEKIGPADPWEYLTICVKKTLFDPMDWKIPSGLRKQIWGKAWPVFESVRAKGTEKEKSSILEWL